MKEFEFIIDQRETCWSRLWVTVDAENEKEALEKCKEGQYNVTDSQIVDFDGDILNEVIMNEHHDILYES